MRALLCLLGLLALVSSTEAEPRLVLPTCSLTASATTIPSGGSSTLTWTTGGASSVILNGAARSANGSLSVSPALDTDYTLVAVGRHRIRTCTVRVELDGSNTTYSFWLGGDFAVTLDGNGGSAATPPGPLAQWALDNIINVTPTSKRPQTAALVNANVERQLRSTIASVGIKPINGLGYDWGITAYPDGDNIAAGVTAHPQFSTLVAIKDQLVASGGDFLYVDEPFSTYGCTDLVSASCLNRQVTVYNQAFAYLKSFVPTLKTGFCMNNSLTTLNLLRTGLDAQFACLESYIQSFPYTTVWDAIHAEFPNVQKFSLVSDTLPLCQLFSGTTTGNPSYPMMIGYWNINQYGLWFAGIGLDTDLLANAQEYAQTGQRQFCKNPRPIFADSPNAAQGTDFNVNTFNSASLETGSMATLTSCEWRVVSYPGDQGVNHYLPSVAATGVQTLPWTAIPCAGVNPDNGLTPAYGGTVVTVTVGSGKMCRHNGTMVCHVQLRATNSLGRVGVRLFPHTINAPGLPGYSP